jgi:hypothetical protein
MNLQDPDLILLFTWTGAKSHHITKYASGYAMLFPSSPIMVITTSLKDILHRSSTKKQLSFIPAILTILSSRLDASFLVHCFSEGGAHNAVQFAKAFLESTGRPLPISALCLDSARGTLECPSQGQAYRWNTADRTPILQILSSMLAYTLAPSCWTTYPVICDAFWDSSIHQSSPDKSRRALNDPSLWDVTTPRCYLFSNDDKWTDPGSVREHARGAEQLGARVFLAPFEAKSPARAPSAAETYWATIQRTWDARSGGASSPPNNRCARDVEKPARHVDAAEAETEKTFDADIHARDAHQRPPPPDRRRPAGQKQTPQRHQVARRASSTSVCSSRPARLRRAGPTRTTAAPPAKSYTGPASFCIKKGKWYDCLRPVPGYQGWGGMGVDTQEFSYARITQRPERR